MQAKDRSAVKGGCFRTVVLFRYWTSALPTMTHLRPVERQSRLPIGSQRRIAGGFFYILFRRLSFRSFSFGGYPHLEENPKYYAVLQCLVTLVIQGGKQTAVMANAFQDCGFSPLVSLFFLVDEKLCYFSHRRLRVGLDSFDFKKTCSLPHPRILILCPANQNRGNFRDSLVPYHYHANSFEDSFCHEFSVCDSFGARARHLSGLPFCVGDLVRPESPTQ